MTTFYITTKKHRGTFLCAFLLIQVWNVPRGTKLWIRRNQLCSYINQFVQTGRTTRELSLQKNKFGCRGGAPSPPAFEQIIRHSRAPALQSTEMGLRRRGAGCRGRQPLQETAGLITDGGSSVQRDLRAGAETRPYNKTDSVITDRSVSKPRDSSQAKPAQNDRTIGRIVILREV